MRVRAHALWGAALERLRVAAPCARAFSETRQACAPSSRALRPAPSTPNRCIRSTCFTPFDLRRWSPLSFELCFHPTPAFGQLSTKNQPCFSHDLARNDPCRAMRATAFWIRLEAIAVRGGRMQKALLVKAALVALIFLLLQAPLKMIDGIVAERWARQQAVVQELAAQSYGRQALAGPVLSIPYAEEYEEAVVEDHARRVETRRGC